MFLMSIMLLVAVLAGFLFVDPAKVKEGEGEEQGGKEVEEKRLALKTGRAEEL